MAYDLLKKCVGLVFNVINILLGGKLPPFGSAGIIVEVEHRYLVVELPYRRIVFPGGFMTWHEQPQETAEREGYEETGLRLQVDDFIRFYAQNNGRWFRMSNISFIYSGHLAEDEQKNGGQLRRSIEGRPCWMDEAELRTRLDPHGLTILNDYVRYRTSRSVVNTKG